MRRTGHRVRLKANFVLCSGMHTPEMQSPWSSSTSYDTPQRTGVQWKISGPCNSLRLIGSSTATASALRDTTSMVLLHGGWPCLS